jgi:hypothetical protein
VHPDPFALVKTRAVLDDAGYMQSDRPDDSDGILSDASHSSQIPFRSGVPCETNHKNFPYFHRNLSRQTSISLDHGVLSCYVAALPCLSTSSQAIR